MILLQITRFTERPEYPEELKTFLEKEQDGSRYARIPFEQPTQPTRYFADNILKVELTDEQFAEIKKQVIDKF